MDMARQDRESWSLHLPHLQSLSRSSSTAHISIKSTLPPSYLFILPSKLLAFPLLHCHGITEQYVPHVFLSILTP